MIKLACSRSRGHPFSIPNLEGSGLGRTDGVPPYLQKLKIEVVIDDSRVETVVNAIAEAAKTGEIGDGKIFISPVDTVVRIRTGDRDSSAL